ncbi:hypothetical protein [Paucibacter sp. B51]|uniref:hypothetical protein n=1 Tax=Paucibacter sp. B51 TaxID=2993315 RepID=UPI0022EBEF88|nr:hypothetical protein [Paucibacter sp. B51]
MMLAKSRPAGIQYMGMAGVSQSCVQAVERLVMAGARIDLAQLLTADTAHALLLHLEPMEVIAVKSGFRSGYAGEGPRALSDTLRLLQAFGFEIDEVEVSPALMKRLDDCALTQGDMDSIEMERSAIDRPAPTESDEDTAPAKPKNKGT